MKVFVYDKKNNRVVAIFENVNDAHYDPQKGAIQIYDSYGSVHEYSRKIVKTRIYQN